MNSSERESILFKSIEFYSTIIGDSLFCSFISKDGKIIIFRSFFENIKGEPIYYLYENSDKPVIGDHLFTGTKKQIINFYKININREL